MFTDTRSHTVLLLHLEPVLRSRSRKELHHFYEAGAVTSRDSGSSFGSASAGSELDLQHFKMSQPETVSY
jgi:hypothetical protein